jgi:hypothetical protein
MKFTYLNEVYKLEQSLHIRTDLLTNFIDYNKVYKSGRSLHI